MGSRGRGCRRRSPPAAPTSSSTVSPATSSPPATPPVTSASTPPSPSFSPATQAETLAPHPIPNGADQIHRFASGFLLLLNFFFLFLYLVWSRRTAWTRCCSRGQPQAGRRSPAMVTRGPPPGKMEDARGPPPSPVTLANAGVAVVRDMGTRGRGCRRRIRLPSSPWTWANAGVAAIRDLGAHGSEIFHSSHCCYIIYKMVLLSRIYCSLGLVQWAQGLVRILMKANLLELGVTMIGSALITITLSLPLDSLT